jgi:microsomal dipeptidase-like Zn-dependent dipeptidase
MRSANLRFLTSLLIIGPLAACGSDAGDSGATPSEVDLLAQAQAIHEAAITIDTHIDIGGNFGTPEVDPCAGTNSKVDIPKMEAGGMDVAFLAVYVGQGPRTPEGHAAAKESALNKFSAIHRVAEEMCPDRVEIAYTADDIERIHSTGKRMFAIGIENGYPIGNDLSLVEEYYNLGARYITLTHNGNNDIADSANPREGEEGEHGGLSEFGRQVVQEMNRLGIMIDVAHVSKEAVMQVFELSRTPIMGSHSGAAGVAAVSRNLDDEQLLALKENGGVIQVVALGSFLQVDPPEYREAVQAVNEEFGLMNRRAMRGLSEEERAEYRARMEPIMPQVEARMEEINARWPRPSVSTIVDHIDYVVELIGIDHVGIGTDFDGGGGVPGFNDASEALNVTVELLRRGYTEEEIKMIWGGNFLRALREVERVAAEVQAEG